MPELPAGDLLITGASGFLGGGVVRRLLARGVPAAAIRCVVRDRGRAEAAGIPAECVRLGDLGEATAGRALAAAVEGVGAVLHLAGTVKAWRRSGFDAVNVDGTRRLVAAVEAAARGAHFVCVSSLAAAGPSVDGVGSAVMPDRCRPVSGYGESKRRGEVAVVGSRLAWTIVRPPVVYGVGDAATRLLFRQACGLITAVPIRTRPLSVIHCDDVVEALLRALTRRPAGVVLPLDGPERTDTHAFLRAIAAACGRRARLFPVPMSVAHAAAVVCDLYASLRCKAGFFSRDKVREIRAAGWVADGEPAFRCVGFTPRVGLAEGLAVVARAEGFAAAT